MAKNLISLLSELRKASPDDPVAYLTDILGKGIKVRREQNAERVLLSVDRQRADFKREIVQQCNGLVLSCPKWEVLAVPPPTVPINTRRKSVAATIAKYKIYEINDGTVVQLYWYNESWRISTANGFDVNKYTWIGEKTYEEALFSLLANVPDFSLDTLDRGYCYTIGFRHHDFHPLKADPERVWFIQKVNLAALNSTKPSLEISYDHAPLPAQRLVESVESYYHLLDKCDAALNRYMETKSGTAPEINYGYILRGSFTELGENANVMIESSLLKKVRTIIYNVPKKGIVLKSPQQRLEYLCLRAYLSHDLKYPFINLFPHLAARMTHYDEVFKKMTARIVSALRSRRNLVAPNNDPLDALVNSFVKYIEKQLQISPFDSQCNDIVMDFVTDPTYIGIYLNYFQQ